MFIKVRGPDCPACDWLPQLCGGACSQWLSHAERVGEKVHAHQGVGRNVLLLIGCRNCVVVHVLRGFRMQTEWRRNSMFIKVRVVLSC